MELERVEGERERERVGRERESRGREREKRIMKSVDEKEEKKKK
jgi:hypothetical protein